jgi:tRNA dimethylallyltransferase
MLASKEKPGIIIVGPTASGKSRLAIGLARRFGGEIVSCDALQLYRYMNIGTAKTPPNEREGIRHHMLDVQDPDRDFSAGDYQRMARESLREIEDRANLPFVVGGTGFYLRALIDGLFDGPSRSEEMRARMRRILQRKGSGILHRSLRRVDPNAAARIAETDAERILRAYEVYLVSGKSMSWWQRQPRNALRGYRWLKIGIHVPRERLYRKINQRTEKMFQAGLLEETRELLKKFPRESHAFKAIGYRQAAEYLNCRISLEQAVEEAKKQSRRYAKRQLTWFRSDPDILWLDGELCLDDLQEKAVDLVAQFLDEKDGSRSAADHRQRDIPSN